MSLQFLNVKSFIDTKVKEKLNELTTSFETNFNSNVNCSTFSNDFNNFIKNYQEGIFNDIKDEGTNLALMLNENESKEAGEYMKIITTEHMKYIHSLYEKKMYECELETFSKNSTYSGELGRAYEFIIQGDVKITKVKKIYDSTHKITFHSVNKILTYQVHKNKNEKITHTHMPIHPDNEGDHPIGSKSAIEYIKNNPEKVVNVDYNLNKQRNVKLTNIDEFIRDFNIVENFKPTTVMEIGFKRYLFVINKIKKDKNNKMSFYISTKEIRLLGKCSNTLVKKIPIGMYKRVRFDIDDYEVYGNSTSLDPQLIRECENHPEFRGCSELLSKRYTEYFCPPGSVITTMDLSSGIPNFCRWNCNNDFPYLVGGICWSGCNRSSDDFGVGDVCFRHNYRYGLFGEYWGDWALPEYRKEAAIPKTFYWHDYGYRCISSNDRSDERQCISMTIGSLDCHTARGDDNRGSCCPNNCSGVSEFM